MSSGNFIHNFLEPQLFIFLQLFIVEDGLYSQTREMESMFYVLPIAALFTHTQDPPLKQMLLVHNTVIEQ